MPSRRIVAIAFLTHVALLSAACARFMPLQVLLVDDMDKSALRWILASDEPPIDDPGYGNALALVAFKGKIKLLEAMLECGGDVNWRSGKQKLAPIHHALHWTTEDFHRDMLRVLLERGADPNIRNAAGETPLHFISLRPFDAISAPIKTEMIALLLARGADPTVASTSEVTALHLLAHSGGPLSAVGAVVAAGGDPAARTASGITPFDLAAAVKNEDLVRYFLDSGFHARVILEDVAPPEDPLEIRDGFHAAAFAFAYEAEYLEVRGERAAAAKAFDQAAQQCGQARIEYARVAAVQREAISGARAKNAERAVGSAIVSALGAGTAATVGMGVVTTPVFTNAVEEHEAAATRAIERIAECQTSEADWSARAERSTRSAEANPSAAPTTGGVGHD